MNCYNAAPMLGRLTFVAFILAVAVSDASSLEALIGDAFVTLPPPAGFCEITPQYEFDAHTLAITSAYLRGSAIRLLTMSADCDQLAEARKGKRRQLDDETQYQVQLADEKTPPVLSVAASCSILRHQTKSPVGVDIKARLAGIVEKIKVNQTGTIGVLGEDKNGCHSAILYKAWSEGTQKMVVGLDAATVLSKRAIAVRRYAVYQNPDTIDAMLAKLEDNVAALVAANP
jgi:hypothetical protein